MFISETISVVRGWSMWVGQSLAGGWVYPQLNHMDRKWMIPKGKLGFWCWKIQCMLGRQKQQTPKKSPWNPFQNVTCQTFTSPFTHWFPRRWSEWGSIQSYNSPKAEQCFYVAGASKPVGKAGGHWKSSQAQALWNRELSGSALLCVGEVSGEWHFTQLFFKPDIS